MFVRFPFSDLSRYKLRPALVLANTKKGDTILCQITSRPYADKDAVKLSEDSFVRGYLIKVSYARPAKLFTANRSIIEKTVASVHLDVRHTVVERIVSLLNASSRRALSNSEKYCRMNSEGRVHATSVGCSSRSGRNFVAASLLS